MTTNAVSRSTSTQGATTWNDFKHISASASRLGLIDFAMSARHTDHAEEFLDMDAEDALVAHTSGKEYAAEPA